MIGRFNRAVSSFAASSGKMLNCWLQDSGMLPTSHKPIRERNAQQNARDKGKCS
jgi:hypothetical protein